MHIFITGGTRGIGKGMVREFLSLGHEVSFTGTSKESIERASSDLSGRFYGIVCDVRKYDEIVMAKDSALKQFNSIDIWINNAGIDQERECVSELKSSNIRDVIDINVTGMMFGTSIALQLMKQQTFGRVYNMEGLGSNNMKIPKTIIYGSTKRLLTYFSKACNKELKDYKDVFVGTISPGMVYTDLLLKNATEESLKITCILADTVERVTPFLVKNMVKGKQHIYWLTTRKTIWRFMISPFHKRTSFEQLK